MRIPQFFIVIVHVLFISFAIQNSRKFFSLFFVFGCALKPAAVGGVLKQKLWIFFILVNERYFGAKVFLIIKILSKKWWKQKLGNEF